MALRAAAERVGGRCSSSRRPSGRAGHGASLWTVGRWPDLNSNHPGASPCGYPFPWNVTRGRYPPPGARMLKTVVSSSGTRSGLLGGSCPGELSGGNWIAAGKCVAASARRTPRGWTRRGLASSPCPDLRNDSGPFGGPRRVPRALVDGSYLVDSASSHMLVSKIKPCMSKYKQLYSETANGSLNQL